MPPSTLICTLPASAPSFLVRVDGSEYGLFGKLQSLKYAYRSDIVECAALEKTSAKNSRLSVRMRSEEATHLPGALMLIPSWGHVLQYHNAKLRETNVEREVGFF